MQELGIKSKLLLAFITVLITITGLNIGLAIYLTNQQGERDAFASLSRQSDLLQTALEETVFDLRAIAERNVAADHNLSDLSTLYAKSMHLATYPEQAKQYERGLLFNKIISLNRLQVILQTADFSSAAMYLDNELSHFITINEAGMKAIRSDGRPLLMTKRNQAGELSFDNWPNWASGNPPTLITNSISPVDRPTISFEFISNKMLVLQIVIPVQAVTRTVMRDNITLGSPDGLLVDDSTISTPEKLKQHSPGDNRPRVIGAFVFRKVFDQAFLEEISNKTGLQPALYSPDGVHQIHLVDLKMKAADLAEWVTQSQATAIQEIQQRTLSVDRDAYYQTLTLWQFEEKPRLIIGFSQSTANTLQKVRETVSGLVGIAGIMLLLGGTLGYILLNHLVKPIRELTAVVSGIGQDMQRDEQGQTINPISSDQLAEINLHRHNEVGQLANAFNTLNRQLRESFETLEKRVAERTEELQHAKEQAESANRAKSTFLANMSHELRTPLNAVLGFSEVMKNSHDVTPDQLENLNIIIQSGEHLLNLINNVLDISKIESGRVELEESQFNLPRLLEDVKSMMHVRAQKKGLDFRLEYSQDLPKHIVGDEGKIRQVLINLIGNAIKYTISGRVSFRARVAECETTDQTRVRLEIEDTGPGLTQEASERIFLPFVQMKDRPAAEAGTGLGLAICKQYVELMDGTIGVHSDPGKGSLFFFEIPVQEISDDANHLDTQSGRIIGLAEEQPSWRLLIVEDQRENRLLLHKLLAPLGCDLREAVNGQEAVDLFTEWHPHLIFMDIRMPVMDGLEATRRIKTTNTTSKTVIIALTAHALEEERREIMAAGCDDFIRKPYRDQEIFDVLTRHLGIRFLYEQAELPSSDTRRSLTASDLNKLPVKLRKQLKQAAVMLDTAAAQQVIREIRSHSSATADALDAIVSDLRFDIIIRLIDSEQSGSGQEDET